MTTFDQRGQAVGAQVNIEPTVEAFKGSEEYDASYYGNTATPKANYRQYGPHSDPHWARPLALWLVQNARGPFLDVGCAFGHLVRELERGTGMQADGIEWSEYAIANKVSVNVERADARAIPYPDSIFGTVVSMDLLEHFEPDDTRRVLREMARVSRPRAFMVHVIGAHNPAEDVARHMSDPTHKNHEPLDWYFAEMAAVGFDVHPRLTEDIKFNPAWNLTDWRDRIVVAQRRA